MSHIYVQLYYLDLDKSPLLKCRVGLSPFSSLVMAKFAWLTVSRLHPTSYQLLNIREGGFYGY